MLDRNSSDLAEAMRGQHSVLEEKRQLLDRAIQAIRKAEESFAVGSRPDSAILKKIIEVVEMQSNNDWSEKYYSPEARANINQRQRDWTPELQAKAQQDWLDLLKGEGKDPEAFATWSAPWVKTPQARRPRL